MTNIAGNGATYLPFNRPAGTANPSAQSENTKP
jgi:hypothetical protein